MKFSFIFTYFNNKTFIMFMCLFLVHFLNNLCDYLKFSFKRLQIKVVFIFDCSQIGINQWIDYMCFLFFFFQINSCYRKRIGVSQSIFYWFFYQFDDLLLHSLMEWTEPRDSILVSQGNSLGHLGFVTRGMIIICFGNGPAKLWLI